MHENLSPTKLSEVLKQNYSFFNKNWSNVLLTSLSFYSKKLRFESYDNTLGSIVEHYD